MSEANPTHPPSGNAGAAGPVRPAPQEQEDTR
jgi:hypothetical protein